MKRALYDKIYIREVNYIINKKLYFNTGELSVVIEELKQGIIKEINYEFNEGRSKKGARKKFHSTLDYLKNKIANIMGASCDEITITDNTTFGMNIVLNGLNFEEKDEILTSNMEHLGCMAPLTFLQHRKNLTIKEYEVKNGKFNVSDFQKLITKKTKLIIISHILWKTGEVIPIDKIISIAHEKNVKVLVDGAQAAGSYPVNLHKIEADFYSFPAHKWLYGPEGLGFLYVKKDLQKSLDVIFTGNSTFIEFDNYNNFTVEDNGKKWELGTMFRPNIYGMINVLNYLSDTIKFENIYKLTKQLNEHMKDLLYNIDDINIITSNSYNIVSISLPEYVCCKSLKEYLETKNIFTKNIDDFNALRISLSFINCEKDIHILLKNILEYVEELKWKKRK